MQLLTREINGGVSVWADLLFVNAQLFLFRENLGLGVVSLDFTLFSEIRHSMHVCLGEISSYIR
jgi:hypothetical protein